MDRADLLGGKEYLAMLLINTSGVIFFNGPRQFFLTGGTAAWISVLVATLVALVTVYVTMFLLRKFPGQGLTDVSTIALGPWLGTVANFVFFLYFCGAAALTIRLLSEAIVMTNLPELPISVVALGCIMLALYASWQGWNTIAKACWVALPFLAVGIVAPLAFTVGQWNTDYLFPLLGTGLVPTLAGGASFAGTLGSITLASLLARALQPHVKPLRLTLWALTGSGLLLCAVVLITAMVFPYPVAEELTLPFYMLSRTLTFGRFLQRLEAIGLVIWAFATVMNLAIMINAGLFIYSQIFAIHDHKPLLIPYGGLVFAIAMLPTSYMYTAYLTAMWLFLYGGIVSLLLPALIVTVGCMRGKSSPRREVPS